MTNVTVPKQVEQVLERYAAQTSRRSFLKGAGMLVVGFATAGSGAFVPAAVAQTSGSTNPAESYPDPDFHQLDSWIVIHENNTATFYVGKTDLGQGTGTAFRQMMCDELDLPYESSSVVMGRTDITVDQGGSGGSDAIQVDGWPMRRVAAEARRVLLEMASQHFGANVDQLAVTEGVVSVKADPSRKITYGELIGSRRFNVTLTGKNIDATTGTAKVKPIQELKLVGQSIPRYDIPGKVDGSLQWAVDVKVPGMLHARNVKPPYAGAKLISIDEGSVRDVPGLVKVVHRENYVAVVCQREEQAIRAARQLKVEWQKPATAPLPSSEDLFTYMRNATPTAIPNDETKGNPQEAFAAAPKLVEADYEIPYQGHCSIGPAHAMADPSNGQMTIYSNDMKSYGMRKGIAEFLQIPRDQVRVMWMDGPQGYGRTAADDAGFEAAFLAKELGRPVRMQWMRNEETGWDTKGPAYTIKLRGGLDAQGRLIALDYDARSADHHHLGYNEPDTVLIAQLAGMGRRSNPNKGTSYYPDNKYFIPHQHIKTQVVSLPLIYETPIRTGNLRDPNGPQTTFAGESFIDELAAAAKVDPIEFRLRLLTANEEDDGGFRRVRSIAVVKAAAKAFGWDSRPSPKPIANEPILMGRGVAYAFRNQTVVAVIAQVEVDRRTGRVWVRRLVCAQDCGLVVNPQGVRHAAEGALLHGLSRAMCEEVTFHTETVTSIDWKTYPTLTHTDVPERIDVVIVNGDPNPNRPDLPPYGAGEPAIKPVMAAVANAIFDATGVRIRRVPFRKERVLAALKTSQV